MEEWDSAQETKSSVRLEKIQEILSYGNQEKKLGKQKVVNLANVSISARQVRTKSYVLDLVMWNSSTNFPSTAVAEKGSIFLVGVLEVYLHMVSQMPEMGGYCTSFYQLSHEGRTRGHFQEITPCLLSPSGLGYAIGTVSSKSNGYICQTAGIA